MRKNVMIVVGTRPEAIKMAPVVLRLREHAPHLSAVVVATAQHRQLLDQVLDVFEIRPDHDLNAMEDDQSLDQLVSRCVTRLSRVIRSERPDLLLTQGDTTTTFSAALAAFYCGVPVGHVEAGLRSGDRHSPYPEEINRKLATTLADLHFSPTERNRQNLLNEGIRPQAVFVTGNTVVDALFWVRKRIRAKRIEIQSHPALDFEGRIILVTTHRRESFGSGLESICAGLKRIAERNPNVRIIHPVHLNPHVREPVNRILGKVPNLYLLEPVDYEAFVWLMERCYFIISDSGGIQEEAPSLGKPVLVTREVTERPEAVEIGATKVVGTDPGRLVAESEKLLREPHSYRAMVPVSNPYGDGRASERIVGIVSSYLGND